MNLAITGGIASSRTTHRVASKRRETAWAWLSLVVLVLCWDAAARLDDAALTSSLGHRGRTEEGAAVEE